MTEEEGNYVKNVLWKNILSAAQMSLRSAEDEDRDLLFQGGI